MTRHMLIALVLLGCSSLDLAAADPKPLKVLFLGDNGHHKPFERFRQLQPILATRNIDLTYTDKLDALNEKTLAGYDALLIYANHTKISPEQEKALIDYVESGKGFVPLHCASYCFLNSPKYIELVGAQFQKHGTGTFRTTPADIDHPLLRGYHGFESWDETYVHTKHNEKDRTVLEYRSEKDVKEPWTWVRMQGKGRVFYTAWGHDERTWSNPAFQNLVERGIRWSVGQDPNIAQPFVVQPEMTPLRKDVKPFEYVDANIAFYPPGNSRGKADRPKQMQKPLDPGESVKHFVTPVGFSVKPFVTEEKLGGKPITMAWDERGRLWVAITLDYPNELQPEGKGRDRIVVCEDTTGSGVCDKVTTFADKLSIPTSLLPCYGGVIVHQAPHTLFLKDTNGDGKADLRQILFTGWGTSDTHAGPSNLRYGLDNWIYGMVGYSAFNGTVANEKLNFRQGFYRFKIEREAGDHNKLKVTKLEFLRNTSNNSWGVGFSEEGLLFGSTANGCPSVYMPIPNAFYESVRGWSSKTLESIAESNKFEPITDKVRQVDWHGGFTAAAGHALYTARKFPREYWNRTAFVAEPTGHLVATFQLNGNGADFRSRNAWNLLASDDEWSAPIMAEVGPDGNVWVIDWYNYIVQHNPTPPGFKTGKGNAYETELRDKKHGRIYRITYGDSKHSERFTLDQATPEKLVATLKSDNMFWRLHAQRLLIERGQKDVRDALLKNASDPATDEIGLNPGVLHSLWTLHGLGLLDGSDAKTTDIIIASLKHRSAAVRRTAVLVAPRKADRMLELEIGRHLGGDPDAQVRLAALLRLAQLPPSSEAAGQVVGALTNASLLNDRWLTDAATSAAAAHAEYFLSDLRHNGLRMGAAGPIQIVAEHFARGPQSPDLNTIMARLPEASPEIINAVLTGFVKGWPKNRKPELSAELEGSFVKLFAKLSPAARGNLLRLAESWGSVALEKHSKEITENLLTQIRDANVNDETRISSAATLIDFRKSDASAVQELLGLLTPGTSPELTKGLLEAIGRSDAKEAPGALLERFGSLTPGTRSTALGLFLLRRDWTPELLKSFEEGKLQTSDLSLDQQRSLASHPDRSVARRANKILRQGGGLPNADRQKVIDEFMSVVKKKGDPEAGKVVFKNQCAKCHVHGSEGSRIGPDLTGMAVHTKEHLLIDILDPSRSVEGNYRVYRVTTNDDKVYNGLLAGETKTAIEIIDAEAKKHTILRQDIEQLQASTKSLMPEGFEKQIKPDELVNLLEFLTQRGKFLPIPLDKAATVVSTKGMFYSADSLVERLIFSDWTPKTFAGVPFQLVDPRGDKVRNVIMLHSQNGAIPPTMPKSVTVPCNAPAKMIHLLGGVSGWGSQGDAKGTVSMIVRLHYEDGKTEDHPLKDGEHFADYIRRVDVPGSKFAFAVRGQQLRYLAVAPKREAVIKEIEFVKGEDRTAPLIVAVTVETR